MGNYRGVVGRSKELRLVTCPLNQKNILPQDLFMGSRCYFDLQSHEMVLTRSKREPFWHLPFRARVTFRHVIMLLFRR